MRSMPSPRPQLSAGSTVGWSSWLRTLSSWQPSHWWDSIRFAPGWVSSFSVPGSSCRGSRPKPNFWAKATIRVTVVGWYELRVNDSDGKPQVEKGTYLTTWRKQKDG